VELGKAEGEGRIFSRRDERRGRGGLGRGPVFGMSGSIGIFAKEKAQQREQKRMKEQENVRV
jgi:hypothetical protein